MFSRIGMSRERAGMDSGTTQASQTSLDKRRLAGRACALPAEARLKLSIVIPVYNEERLVLGVLRRGAGRQGVGGRRRLLAGRHRRDPGSDRSGPHAGDLGRSVRPHPGPDLPPAPEPGEGSGAAPRIRGSARRRDRGAGRRPRVRPPRAAAPLRPDRARRGGRRVREPVRPRRRRVSLPAHGGQPIADRVQQPGDRAAGERHGDLLQGDSRRPSPRAAPARGPLRLRARGHRVARPSLAPPADPAGRRADFLSPPLGRRRQEDPPEGRLPCRVLHLAVRARAAALAQGAARRRRGPRHRMTGVPLRTAAVAVAAREAWFHLVSEPIATLPGAARQPPPESRYEQVRLLLPATGRIGYLTDLPVSTAPGAREGAELGTWLYTQAAYALAPLVLVYGDDAVEPVLANLADPAHLEELARRHGLRVEARLEGGQVALLRR